MRKLCILIGTAVVGAILLISVLATATFAQGIGPVNMGLGIMGDQGTIQCAAPITPTQSFSPTAPGVFGSSHSDQGGYGPGMMSGYGAGEPSGMMGGFDSECGGPGIDGQVMMGGQGYDRFGITGQRQTAVEVQQAVVTYLAGYYNNPDLAVVEADGLPAELLRQGGREVDKDQRLRIIDRSLHRGDPARIWAE